jgi:hypothetical protein
VTAGVGVYLGQTRFTKRNAVAVEGRELRFNKAVIATGSRAVAPMRYDLERGGVEQERAFWARRSRRGPTQVQGLLFRFRGFSSVKYLGNDPR